jgi:PAS domain S-box-containing protein
MQPVSVKTKIALSVSILILVLYLVSTFVVLSLFRNQIKDIIGREQFDFLSEVARGTDKNLREAQRNLIQASAHLDAAAIRKTGATAADAFLSEAMQEHLMLSNIFDNGITLFSPTGVMLAALPHHEREGEGFSYREYIQRTIETKKPYISKPYFSTRPDTPPAVMLTVPVFDRQGRLTAILGGSVTLTSEGILGDIGTVKIGKTGYMYLFSADRTLLIHPNKGRILKQDVPPGANKLFDRAIAGFEGSGETVSSKGLPLISSFKRLKTTDWILAANYPLAEAYASVTQAREYLILFIIIGIALSIFVVWLVMNRFLTPLSELTRQIQEMGQAAPTAAAPDILIKGTGEIGQLALAFREMVKRLAERENQLREAEALYRTLTERSFAGVYVVQDGVFQYLNENAAAFAGYTPAELIGKAATALLHPEDTGKGKTLSKAMMTGASTAPYEFRIKTKEGGTRWIMETVAPIVFNGRPAILGNSLEVTERKMVEEAIHRAKEAAESANRAKSEFLANMSHEIRTPMNAILGMAELLAETPLTRNQQKYVRIFRNAGENLLTLINDILDLSKVEAGQVTLEAIPFDLGETIERTGEILSMRAGDKGLDLVCHIQPDIPVDVIGDPLRLRQIITNLIGNAVKFTETGEILLEVKAAPHVDSIGAERIDLAFSVADTGIGIAADKVEHIFEKFTQADTSTSRKYGGTGLGLAITRYLVELMGGTLKVRSELGKGSVFSFTIRLPRQLEAQPREDSVPFDLTNVRILVVDDNATNRLIVKEFLAPGGATVAEAADGQEGLRLMREAAAAGEPYHLVILDHQMPVMDGMETAHRIKDDPDLSAAVLILLTSLQRTEDREKAEQLGFVQTLFKPVKRADLREAATGALGRRKLTVPLPETEGGEWPSATPVAPLPQQPLRILLAEDNEDNRTLVWMYLKNTPHEMQMAENGQLALDRFINNGPFDLVFMDVQMPVMDGYTATRAIRLWEEEQGRERTPIVALTAYALKEDIQKSLDAGCDGHVTKPLKKATFLNAIAQYAAGKEVNG